MAEVGVALAISAITTAASTGLQYALTKKVKPTPVDRGRLDDIRISAPGFGASLIRGYGTYRVAPIWFWDTDPVHHTTTTPGQSGGKGIGGGGTPPTPETTDHFYTKSLAGAIGDRMIYGGVSRIWFNAELVYNSNNVTGNLTDTSSTRYEAEHGVLAGGANVATGAQYSNGNKVQGIGSGGSVTIHCDVAATGSYELAVAYTAATQKTFNVSVNGGATVDLVCRATGGAGLVGVEVMTVTLTAGANTIAFSNSGASAPDLDSVSIAPALTLDGPGNTDPRGFTGIITPGRLAPSGQDTFWPVADELPAFTTTATEEGAAGDGVYSATLAQWGNVAIRIYSGSEEQLQDPAIIADKGIDNTPAYRGTPYIVLDTLQITAQRPLPNVTVEVQQGVREVIPILTDIYEEVGVPASKLELSQLAGFVIGDTEGFDPGTYAAVTWTGLNNATAGANGAITKTSGTNNAWNSYAHNGASIGAGTDAAFRFVAGTGTFMIGFSLITTPGGSLPNPYAQVPFAVLLNLNSKPSQASKNAIQMSLGGSNNTNDVGVWAPGDVFQVEIRNGRFSAYQNGLLLAGFAIPVPTFPLIPVFAGYAIGGGPASCSFATGANIGSEPIVANGGGLISPTQTEAAELVVDLMTRFQFDLPEVDGKVKAVLRNKDAADITITEDELRAHMRGSERPRAAVTITDRNPIEVPHTVEVNFLNPQYDYHNDTADDPQLIAGPQRGINSISLNLIETRQNMKNLAVLLRHKAKMEAREYKFQTGPKYIKAHKGTRIDIVMNSGNVYKTTVDSMRTALPAGVIDFTAKRHAVDVFNPVASGFNIGLEKPIAANPGNTKGVILDAPLVEPESSATPTEQSLQYVAVCGRGSGFWPGAFILREFPLDSDQFETLTTSDTQATIGQTSGTLPTWTNPDTKDTTSSLVVDFHNDAQCESVTEAELLANSKLNLLAVKNPSTGDVEYVQFQTATLGSAVSPFIKRYTFTNLFRGRNNTISAAPLHTSTDEVVLMNSAVKVMLMSAALLGVSCHYKFVTAGQDVDDAPTITQVWRGFSLKATPPNPIAGTFDTASGGLLTDWFDETQSVPGQDPSFELEIRDGNPGTTTVRGPLTIRPLELQRISSTPPLVKVLSGGFLTSGAYTFIEPGGFNAVWSSDDWNINGLAMLVESQSNFKIAGGFMIEAQTSDLAGTINGLFPSFFGIKTEDVDADPPLFIGWTKAGSVNPDVIVPSGAPIEKIYFMQPGDRFTMQIAPDGTVSFYINYMGASSDPWWVSPVKLQMGLTYRMQFINTPYATGIGASFYTVRVRNTRWLRQMPEFLYTGDMQREDNSGALPSSVHLRVRKKSIHPLGPASDWRYATFTRP